MGVGAIFVSTLALTKLPEPQSPPVGQAEYLAATIQTVVSFVVLGSIIVRKSRLLKDRSIWSLRLSRWSFNPFLLRRSQHSQQDGVRDKDLDPSPKQYPGLVVVGTSCWARSSRGDGVYLAGRYRKSHGCRYY